MNDLESKHVPISVPEGPWSHRALGTLTPPTESRLIKLRDPGILGLSNLLPMSFILQHSVYYADSRPTLYPDNRDGDQSPVNIIGPSSPATESRLIKLRDPGILGLYLQRNVRRRGQHGADQFPAGAPALRQQSAEIRGTTHNMARHRDTCLFNSIDRCMRADDGYARFVH